MTTRRGGHPPRRTFTGNNFAMTDTTTGMQTTPSDGIMRAADGTPLKQSLARALRREKFRSFMLVLPLYWHSSW